MVLKGFLPLLVHYNDDGCFIGRRHRASNETIHDFLRKNDIDVSLVLFQRNVVVDHDTVSTAGGKNVTDSSVDVSSGIIETITDTGEKIFQVNFKTKEAYTLHNSTSGAASEHDEVTRTSEIQYYARNPVIDIQTSLLRFMPWVTRNLAPSDHREKRRRASQRHQDRLPLRNVLPRLRGLQDPARPHHDGLLRGAPGT